MMDHCQTLPPCLLRVDTVDKIGDGRAAALMPHARPAAAVCCLPLRATSNATELYLRQLMFKQSSYWGRPPEVVRQCFEVLHDCGEVELVARPRQPSQSHALKAMMGLEVGKPHLDFLALVA